LIPAHNGPDDFPQFPPKRAISQSESSPPPAAYANDPPLRTNGKRSPSTSRGESTPPPPPSVLTPIPPELVEKPFAKNDEPPVLPPSVSVPKTITPVDAMPPPAAVHLQPVRSDSVVELRGVVEPATATVDTRKNFSFWLGMAIGIGLGMAAGATIFAFLMK